jgi:uncharacterized protein (TIGR03437 family)
VPEVTFTLTARLPGPTLTASSFKNGAGFQTGVVSGSVVTIQGPGVAPGVQGCIGSGSVSGPLPLSLGGVEVAFGSSAAPLYSVCNVGGMEQATVQAPFGLASGTTNATVRVQGGSTVVNNVQILPAQPGIFEYRSVSDGRFYAVVTRPDGSFVGPDNRLRRGEIGRAYLTGLGPVIPQAVTNTAGVAGQEVLHTVIVGVNNAGVRVLSAEYAENMIGVYVVEFEVPSDTATGVDVPFSIAVITAALDPPVYSNPSRIAIQ